MKKTILFSVLFLSAALLFAGGVTELFSSSKTETSAVSSDAITLSDNAGNSVTFWKDGTMSGKVFGQTVQSSWSGSSAAAASAPTTTSLPGKATSDKATFAERHGNSAVFHRDGKVEIQTYDFGSFAGTWNVDKTKNCVLIHFPEEIASYINASDVPVFWGNGQFTDPFSSHLAAIYLDDELIVFKNQDLLDDVAVFRSGDGKKEIRFLMNGTFVLAEDGSVSSANVGKWWYEDVMYEKESNTHYDGWSHHSPEYKETYLHLLPHWVSCGLFVNTPHISFYNVYKWPEQVLSINSSYSSTTLTPDIWSTDMILYDDEYYTRVK